VCAHEKCKELRDAGKKHLECEGNSRRLHQAWEFTVKVTGEWKQRSKDIPLSECEGDVELRKNVQTMLRHMGAQPQKRLQYMNSPLGPQCIASHRRAAERS